MRIHSLTRKQQELFGSSLGIFSRSTLAPYNKFTGLAAKTHLRSFQKAQIILPLFVGKGEGLKERIVDFPGVFRYSPDELLKKLRKIPQIKSILLFGVAERKDPLGSGAWDPEGAVQETVRLLKKKLPKLEIITDVCLCGFTSHGHCAVLKNEKVKKVDIDSRKTLEALGQIALSHAKAGADWVAPSAMAKHQVAVIRRTLDRNGFRKVKILGYSAKFASHFYGPFRNALRSKPAFGDRTSYQLPPADTQRALREIADDLKEGADWVMVKPALPYLDIIAKAKDKFKAPLVAYQVSGEYLMIKRAAGGNKELERTIVLETLTAIRRAGADFIITYFAPQILKWLKQ